MLSILKLVAHYMPARPKNNSQLHASKPKILGRGGQGRRRLAPAFADGAPVTTDTLTTALAFSTVMQLGHKKRADGEQPNWLGKGTAPLVHFPGAFGVSSRWCFTSSHGPRHPEVQVSRWGLPLITHIFLKDSASSDLKEEFNASTPSEDVSRFAPAIAAFAEKMTAYAGSAPNPAEYGKQLAARLCPTTLPYEIGTPAVFDVSGFNGRTLADDAMDVMLTLTANQPLADGAAPDTTRIRAGFPWYGEPYSKDEQAGVTPMLRPANSPTGRRRR